MKGKFLMFIECNNPSRLFAGLCFFKEFSSYLTLTKKEAVIDSTNDCLNSIPIVCKLISIAANMQGFVVPVVLD